MLQEVWLSPEDPSASVLGELLPLISTHMLPTTGLTEFLGLISKPTPLRSPQVSYPSLYNTFRGVKLFINSGHRRKVGI